MIEIELKKGTKNSEITSHVIIVWALFLRRKWKKVKVNQQREVVDQLISFV